MISKHKAKPISRQSIQQAIDQRLFEDLRQRKKAHSYHRSITSKISISRRPLNTSQSLPNRSIDCMLRQKTVSRALWNIRSINRGKAIKTACSSLLISREVVPRVAHRCQLERMKLVRESLLQVGSLRLRLRTMMKETRRMSGARKRALKWALVWVRRTTLTCST